MDATTQIANQLLGWLSPLAARRGVGVADVLAAALAMPPAATPRQCDALALAAAVVEMGAPLVNRVALSSARLTRELVALGAMEPKTGALENMLLQLGFSRYGRVKIDGETHRVWATVEISSNDEARELLKVSQ